MRGEGAGRGCPWAVAMWALFGYAATSIACATAVDPVQSVDGAGAAESSDEHKGADEGGSGSGASVSSSGGAGTGSAGQGAESGASGSGGADGSRSSSDAGVDSGGQGNIGGDGGLTAGAEGGGTGDDGSADGDRGDGSDGDGSGGDAGAGNDGGACPAGLLDKITTCSASSPRCVKGCGPETTTGNLGSKACSCNASTLVYNCQSCSYPSPLPSCYQPGASPQTCTSGVASNAGCATPCGGVCTQLTDAGKTDGCVCIQLSSGTMQWTCATRWW